MIKKNYGSSTLLQTMTMLLIGINTSLFFYMPGYAEEPNVGPLLVQVVNPISGEKILPTTYPLPGIQSTTLLLSACRGEYEPASFVVRGINDSLNSIMVASSDLVGDQGTIDKKYVDIKVVKVWYQAAGAWLSHAVDRNGGNPQVLVPELLVNDETIIKVDTIKQQNYIKLQNGSGFRYELISDNKIKSQQSLPSTTQFTVRDAESLQAALISNNANLQYWITVHVPQASQSGKYKGTIAISNTFGRTLKTLKIEVDVLPFELAESIIEYSLYYRGKLAPRSPTISSEFKNEQQLRAELQNIREHGIRNPTVYQRYWPKDEIVLTNVEESKKLLKDYLAIRRELHMTNVPLYYLGRTVGPDSSSNLKLLEADVSDLLRIGGDYSFTELFLYGKDEAKGKELLKEKEARGKVQKLGAKILSAGYKDHFEEIGNTDILVLNGTPSAEKATEVHRRGKKIFSYHNPQTGPEDPALFRRKYGIELWQSNFDGAMIYAYQHSMGAIWNDFDHQIYRDHVFAYPTIDGVIDTIAWEGFREAIDDVRYISTLVNLIEKNENSQPAAQKIQKALHFLAELKTSNKFKPQEVRSELISLLLELSVALLPLSPPSGITVR